jgi:hypothetical protein
MKRRSRSRSIDDPLAAPEGAPCLNAEFLLHLERAVREIRRERSARRSLPANRIGLPQRTAS